MGKPIFKCRASAIGKIMTEPKGKSNLDKYNDAVSQLQAYNTRLANFKDAECKSAVEIRDNKIPQTKALIAELELVKDRVQLSETCIQHLTEWVLEKKYNKRKEFKNKFTEKGNKTEQDGFQLIQKVLYDDKLFLNEFKKFLEDDYFTGTPDVIVGDTVIDNKSSWNIFTFPKPNSELSDKGYEFQGRGYMRLSNKGKFILCYTLNDTPVELVEREIGKFRYDNNITNLPDQDAFRVALNCLYTQKGLDDCNYLFFSADTSEFVEVPMEKRLRKFEFDRDLEIESQMVERVKDCQRWVEENYELF